MQLLQKSLRFILSSLSIALFWGISDRAFAQIQAQMTINDWQTGFCATFLLQNTGGSQESWNQFQFQLQNAQISSKWSGDFSNSNGIFTVTPLSWNQNLPAGGNTQIGFCANGSGRPTFLGLGNQTPPTTSDPPIQQVSIRPKDFTLEKNGIRLNSRVTGDWSSGYCRTLTLNNPHSTLSLKNWNVSFITTNRVENWSSTLTKNGSKTQLLHANWNEEILPGKNQEIGFCSYGNGGDDQWEVFGDFLSNPLPPTTPTTPKDTNLVNGSCGSHNNAVLEKTPTLLCGSGNPTSVGGNGPWSWSCQGISGGVSASCQAQKTQIQTPTKPIESEGITVFTFSSGKNRKNISPYIYGRNWGEQNTENLASARLGGNRLTGYNWETNASNAGSDWIHSSDSYLSSSLVPAKVITNFHDANQKNNIPYSLITLQMAGYVANDRNGTVYEYEKAPSQRWIPVIAEKPTSITSSPSLTDNKVYMDELVLYLTNIYGSGSSNKGIRAYALDNEPALWQNTHPRIHPNKPTVQSVLSKSIALARAIKKIDPSAEVFGGNTYGYAENRNFQDASDWSQYANSYPTYIDAYLGEFRKEENRTGKKLLDVFDFHWYPEAHGKDKSGNRIRVTENNTDPGVAEARMQAPRALWDPTYTTEDSWIAQWFQSSAYPVIPKIQESIKTHAPGTKIGIGEFHYGASHHISGGIAQADLLGIFGRYGVYFASLWGDVDGYISTAYKLYRNPDGKNTAFGNVSVDISQPNPQIFSSYGSVHGNGGKADIVLINKSSQTQKIRIQLEGVTSTGGIAYGFDANGTQVRELGNFSIKDNTFEYTLSPTSATRFLFFGKTQNISSSLLRKRP